MKNLVVPTSITDTTVELKCMRTFYSKNGLLSAVVRWRVPGICHVFLLVIRSILYLLLFYLSPFSPKSMFLFYLLIIKFFFPGHVVGIQFDYSLDKCKKKVKNKDRKTVLLNARRREIQLVDLYEDCRYFLQVRFVPFYFERF